MQTSYVRFLENLCTFPVNRYVILGVHFSNPDLTHDRKIYRLTNLPTNEILNLASRDWRNNRGSTSQVVNKMFSISLSWHFNLHIDIRSKYLLQKFIAECIWDYCISNIDFGNQSFHMTCSIVEIIWIRVWNGSEWNSRGENLIWSEIWRQTSRWFSAVGIYCRCRKRSFYCRFIWLREHLRSMGDSVDSIFSSFFFWYPISN